MLTHIQKSVCEREFRYGAKTITLGVRAVYHTPKGFNSILRSSYIQFAPYSLRLSRFSLSLFSSTQGGTERDESDNECNLIIMHPTIVDNHVSAPVVSTVLEHKGVQPNFKFGHFRGQQF